jgi:8-oxo-dGTP pyrophosphatase MutT (NUDIX family)
MNLLASFVDDQYPNPGIDHVRLVSRAIVVTEEGLAAVHHLIRDDVFGKFDYYETPGGGVDNGESPEHAAIRECREEIGYLVRVEKPLGEVDDCYNLLHRKNRNLYFLCRRVGPFLGTQFKSKGDAFIQETLYLPIKDIIALYQAMPDTKLPLLVKRRELPIWSLALQAGIK